MPSKHAKDFLKNGWNEEHDLPEKDRVLGWLYREYHTDENCWSALPPVDPAVFIELEKEGMVCRDRKNRWDLSADGIMKLVEKYQD